MYHIKHFISRRFNYLFYNLAVTSYEGALGDAILLISLVTGIIRFDILPKIKEKN